MWYEECVFYQIYPLGLCGASAQNDGVTQSRILKVLDWVDYIRRLGAGAVLFNPVFDSDAHGYDTRDLRKIDPRLGTAEDFARVCAALHGAGLKVVLDGVFNHVGRGFWAFQDLLARREASPYRDWFHVDFGRDNAYGDGLWYEGWEGHYDLVKLNLRCEQVVEHLLGCVQGWVDAFGIDGLRLDVAYCLDKDFLRRMRAFSNAQGPNFFLLGEALHGDYKQVANPEMLHSATNYECYKGLYSSLNSHNLFEIAHSLGRQFGPEDWTLYKGLPLFNFVDNHDVTRAASILENPAHLPLLYGLLMGMPGIPCLYYGSEWGAEGIKQNGTDAALRPAFDAPVENDLSRLVARLCAARTASGALCHGGYHQLYLTNEQFVFERKTDAQRVLVAVNAAGAEHAARFEPGAARATDLLTGQTVDMAGGLLLPGYSLLLLELSVSDE